MMAEQAEIRGAGDDAGAAQAAGAVSASAMSASAATRAQSAGAVGAMEPNEVSAETAVAAICALQPGQVLRVSGAPKSGKSTVCFAALTSEQNRERLQSGAAVLICSRRKQADALSEKVFLSVGSSHQSRLVKTLPALAFSVLAAQAAAAGGPAPKLLDASEQNRILGEVIQTHIDHVESGDECPTCRLLRAYLAADGGGQTAAQAFKRLLAPAFQAQLRDVIARLSELGVPNRSAGAISPLAGVRDNPLVSAQMQIEWDAAVALRAEYAQQIDKDYPGQFRIDSSFMLHLAQRAVDHAAKSGENLGLPELVIIDDCQDLTLAGYGFVAALVRAGAALALVGNDDESVQSFRGAYPEALSELECRPIEDGGLGARQLRLSYGLPNTYANAVATRVSRAIGSTLGLSDEPVPRRAGKMRTEFAGTDATLRGRLFRSEQQEIDDLVWQVASAVLSDDSHKLTWGDLAVIAHDNTQVRAIGERLEQSNVPVSYSAVSQPLKSSPTVQGLLAMLRLGAAAAGIADGGHLRVGQAHVVVEQLKTLMASPLFLTSAGRQMRFGTVESAVTSVASLVAMRSGEAAPTRAGNSSLTNGDAANGNQPEEAADDGSALGVIEQEWRAIAPQQEAPEDSDDPRWQSAGALNSDSIIAVLLFGSAEGRLAVGHLIDSVLSYRWRVKRQKAGHFVNPDLQALWNACEAVRAGRERFAKAQESAAAQGEAASGHGPQVVSSALWEMWSACNVAELWRDQALEETADGRSANEQLDDVIRLLHQSAGALKEESPIDFADRIKQAEIAADSLAHVAPRPNAVTLTTPAGAIGMSAQRVWITGMQQGVWPNLAPRGALFSTQALADLLLAQRLGIRPDISEEVKTEETLYAEMKSFLVALTRASHDVTISAVWSEESKPSEFLFEFMPELFANGSIDTVQVLEPSGRTHSEPRQYTPVGGGADGAADPAGSDITLPGFIAVARARLAHAILAGDQAAQSDAAEALATLTRAGIKQADPANWPFVTDMAKGYEPANDPLRAIVSKGAPARYAMASAYVGRMKGEAERLQGAPAAASVHVSPSEVDNIWKCPLKWSFEKRFGGPQPSSASATYGTLIHACAQWATECGYDRDSSIADWRQLRGMLMEHYRQLVDAMPAPTDGKDQYQLSASEQRAQVALGNIAQYFIDSRDPQYSAQEKQNFSGVGALAASAAEVQFSAAFSIENVCEFVRRSPGLDTATGAELYSVLNFLADAAGLNGSGFAKGAIDEKTEVQLSARYDRLERRGANGERVDVIDYKTGKPPAAFTDLQLICYQLAFIFGAPTDDNPDDDATRAALDGLGSTVGAAHLDRSMLFKVNDEVSPSSHGQYKEVLYQPPLVDDLGMLNRKMERGSYRAKVRSLFHDQQLLSSCQFEAPDDSPAQYAAISGEIRALLAKLEVAKPAQDDELDLLIWALSMLSRVFYAASYKVAAEEPAKTGQGCSYCVFKPICPAWPKESSTMYGPVAQSAMFSSQAFQQSSSEEKSGRDGFGVHGIESDPRQEGEN